MTLTFDNQTLLLVGVGAQLLGSLAKTLFRKPRQQAQIDRIEAKVNDTIAQIAPVASTLQALRTAPAPAAATPTPPPPSWVAAADTTKGPAQ